MSLKTLLIRPSNPTGSAYLTKWGFLPVPLGLLQLAGSLLALDDSEVRVLVGMMLGAPYETWGDMLATARFLRILADAGADGAQFTTYTPLPGTRAFDDALKNDRLFTLDWNKYDVLTPVMKTRVRPELIQLLQAYGTYSFYVMKWLKGRARGDRRRGPQGFKKELVSNSERFIFGMMPTYLKDMLGLPSQVMKTHRLYASLKEMEGVSEETVRELREPSSKAIYLETGGRNPYFLIREAE